MSQTTTIDKAPERAYSFNVNSFNGVKMNANEPWLYAIWYFVTAGLFGFFSGVLWTPLAIAWFGTFYSPISQTIVLNPAGELLRDGGQIFTGVVLYVVQFVGMYRMMMKGHGLTYLIQTIRFGGDEYTIVPLVIDNHNVKNMDPWLKKDGMNYHFTLLSVSIPYPLALAGKLRNVGIAMQKFFGFAKQKGYWKPYQPFDYELLIHEGTIDQTFRPHEGKVPYMNILEKVPLTIPLGTTVYYAKRMEKKGRLVPVMYIHDSPYSPEKVLANAGLQGLKGKELKDVDTTFDAHTALDKDERIEQLERENIRLEVALGAEQIRKDKDIVEDREWIKAGLDDPTANSVASQIFSRNGLIAIAGFTLLVVGILAAYRAHWLG